MSVYVDDQLKELIKLGVIQWGPDTPAPSVQPSSVDLHLTGPILRQRPKRATLLADGTPAPVDLLDPYSVEWVEVRPRPGQRRSWVLEPGAFVLGSTSQAIMLGDGISAKVEGKSTPGRHGLIIQTAGWVEAGFKGHITLEIANVGALPLIIWEHMPICQVVIHSHWMGAYASRPYSGQYQGQTTTTPPGAVR